MTNEDISNKLTPEEKKQVEAIKNKVAAQIAKTGRTVVNVTDLFGDDEDRAVARDQERRADERNFGKDYERYQDYYDRFK